MKIDRTILLTCLLPHCPVPNDDKRMPKSDIRSPRLTGHLPIFTSPLRKLNVLGSVLYLAAHPDDENTRLIAYFSKDKFIPNRVPFDKQEAMGVKTSLATTGY
jgi:hypothetical protein